MSSILVTGGTGHLGRHLVPTLLRSGHRVRILTRAPGGASDVEWARADLGSGEGLAQAMTGIDTIVNAATNSQIARRGGSFRPSDFLRAPSEVDLDGTRHLIEDATRAGVRRFVHVSIVAIDRANYPYGRVKFAGEMLVRESGLDWSVVRATPFYYLPAGFFDGLRRLPVWLLPTRVPFQPCDPRDFAAYVAACVEDGGTGMRQDFGGPEVLTLGDMAHQHQAARGIHRPIVRMPLGPLRSRVGPMFPTAPGGLRGTTTWSAWLRDERAAP